MMDSCIINYCQAIGIWVTSAETDPICCDICNSIIAHCNEGIRLRNGSFTIEKSIICYCQKGVHCNESLALALVDNCIHECKSKAFRLQYVQLFKMQSNAIYDCSSGCDIQSVSNCHIVGNCLLFIKNQLFLLTNCFVFV